jgi:hypothetical protein
LASFLLISDATTPQEETMRTFTEKIEAWFSAVAFAEAGEHSKAAELASCTAVLPKRKSVIGETFTRIFAAVAFAEEGLTREAEQIYSSGSVAAPAAQNASFLDMVGLGRAPVHLVIARPKPSFLDVVGLGGSSLRYVMARS